MALHHLLFRCPQCGHDPTEGERDHAACPACGATFLRVRKGGEIRIQTPSEEPREERIEELLRRIDDFGGALESDMGPDGRVRRTSEVLMRKSSEEQPLRFKGSVLGFVEALSEGEHGHLHLQEDRLAFVPSGGQEDEGAPTVSGPVESAGNSAETWDLLDIRAVQSASSAVQISPPGGGMVQFQFVSDSPFRWEALLKAALQTAYAEAGRGEIREFQPRIVCG